MLEANIDNAGNLWHLKQVSLMQGLQAADFEVIMNMTRDRIYSKNEVIFRPDQPAHHLFILKRGAVRLSLLAPDGGKKTRDFLTTPDIFGETPLCDSSVYQGEAVAQEESWISLLPKTELRRLLHSNSILATNFFNFLCQKLVESREALLNASFRTVEGRLARLLLRLSDQMGKKTLVNGQMTRLKIKIPHEALAQMVGANRPHVSTIMSGFKRRGLVVYCHGRILLDTGRLRLVVDGDEQGAGTAVSTGKAEAERKVVRAMDP